MFRQGPLGLADTEYFSATDWADPSGRRAAILQGNLLRISYLLFSSALKAIGFHQYSPKYDSDVPVYMFALKISLAFGGDTCPAAAYQ